MTAGSDDRAELRITGNETSAHSVPVDVLVRALQGLQQTALILAFAVEQRPVEQRFRPSNRLRQRCELRCGPLAPGSVAITIGFEPGEPLLFPDQPDERLMKRLLRFVGAVARNDTKALGSILPDSRLRTRAIRETLGYLPRGGQRWGLELHNGGEHIRLGQDTRGAIGDWFRESDEDAMVVTGRLVRIDFLKNKVSIQYPPTGKTFAFHYEVDGEDLLLENRREWVQAHGRFELDRDGRPWKVIEVTRLEPLDLSPLTFEAVPGEGATLRLDPPLHLTPELDEDSKQLIQVEDKDLDLFAFANTREELVREVNSQLALLWREYANENPDRLTQAARKLRELLRLRIREDHAA